MHWQKVLEQRVPLRTDEWVGMLSELNKVGAGKCQGTRLL